MVNIPSGWDDCFLIRILSEWILKVPVCGPVLRSHYRQAKDLITYIGESDARGESIWETNIFGKSIEQLVQDGIRSKLTMISEESQVKLQDTMQKIVNDSKGGDIWVLQILWVGWV